jgi:chromosome segregation ATPase
MRNNVVKVLTTITVLVFLLSLIGCNESNLTDHELRRSKLIISQLQQQLVDCQGKIKQAEQKLEDCENEKDEFQQQNSESVTILMETFKMEKESLIKENAELKAEINELKGQ